MQTVSSSSCCQHVFCCTSHAGTLRTYVYLCIIVYLCQSMSMFVSLSISFLSFLWQFFFIKSGPIHGRLVCILVHIHPLTSHIPHAPCISLLMILTFSLFISQDANLWFSLFLQVTIILKLFMIERQILTTSHFWKLNPMKRFGRTAELLLQIGSRGPFLVLCFQWFRAHG